MDVTLPFPGAEMVQPMIDMLQGDLKAQQSLELALRLAASPKDLVEGEEAVLLQLIKGASLDVKTNLWKGLPDVLMQLTEMGVVPENISPIFGGVSPLLLLKANASLSVEIDEEMKTKLSENPILEIALMDTATLIQSMAGIGMDDEEEFDNLVEEKIPFPNAKDEMKFILNHIGDDLTYTIYTPLFALELHIAGEKLSSLLKAGSLIYLSKDE